MKGAEYIKTKQILWAKRRNLKLSGSQNGKGRPAYVKTFRANLFEPLTQESKKQFKDGDGKEIKNTSNKSANMRAVHSSSAIAVNIFQHWSKIKKVYQIAHACRLCNAKNHSSEEIFFEKKYKIDNAFSRSPNIDVVIKNSEKFTFKVFAIECKFSEAYRRHKGLSPRYLKLKPLWKDIPKTYDLAKIISPIDKNFKYLHAAQLIKHILGLKKEYGKKAFRLLYLWYDVHGEESYEHRKEIEQFTRIVKSDDIKFISISYQKLISNLNKNYYEGNEEYMNYITERYL